MGETHTSDVRVNGPTVGFFIALREIQEDVTFFFLCVCPSSSVAADVH